MAPDAKSADMERADVEQGPAMKPDYLAKAILNVRMCCPSFTFAFCPCCLCSCFGGFITSCMAGLWACMTCCMKGLWACAKCPFNCMKACCAALFTCAKQCIGACCKPCMGLCTCLKNCILKCCAPCIKCAKCLCAPFAKCAKCLSALCMKCAKCLNCCNIECGLPCRKPPGCVCIFPCTACGVGLTLPYCCFSCGWDHCIKMPKEERQYWWNSKVAAPKMQDMKKTMQDMNKTSNAEKIQALEAEIEQLKKAESDFDAVENA